MIKISEIIVITEISKNTVNSENSKNTENSRNNKKESFFEYIEINFKFASIT